MDMYSSYWDSDTCRCDLRSRQNLTASRLKSTVRQMFVVIVCPMTDEANNFGPDLT